MKRAALALLVVPFIALWMVACDGEPPSAPEATPTSTPLFGGKKIPPDQQTECYKAGMLALEASDAYGDAAKDLAKCDQAAAGPCELEQETHVTAWLALSDLYENALAICGGEPPSENLPPEISSVEISPNPAYPDTPELTCQAVYSDPDGDDLSVSYKWLKDGSATAAVANVYPPSFLTGEYYSCEVTVSDGQAQDVAFGDLYIAEALCEPDETESRECPYGDPEIRICQGNGTWGPWSDCIEPNTPPEITGVTIEPANPTTATQSLECVLQGWTDADGDFVNFYFEWYGDGVPDTETSNVLSLGGVSAGQQFYCAIIADDGTDQTRVESQVVTIAVEPNVLDYLLVSEVLQNPQTATGDGEFIEIYNSASFAVDVGGVSIWGSGTSIALTGSIPAGAYCVYSDVATTPGTCAVYPTLEINDFGGVRVSLVANSTEGHRFIYEDTGYPASPGISVGLPILDSRAYPCEQAATPGAANSECI